MDAKELYQKIDEDFELELCKDDWSRMDYNKYISNNFRKRYMGVLLDNSLKIESVYTAVFPSDLVLDKILKSGIKDGLLITHHPMVWDIRKAPQIFTNINPKFLPRLKERQISIYTIHVPLDKNSKYSTTTNLAKALEIAPEGEFYEYFGVKVGIFGETKLKTSEELAEKLKAAVGHKVKLWKYGSNEIYNNKVALVAGGGNEIDIIQEILDLGINTYITGVTLLNDYSKPTHDFEKKHKINLIGGTHYSTEKFACIALCDYFKNVNLPCEFIEDFPVLEDLE
ncbi:MAG: Nif3-like dinuclear metal center hexameric protein [Candidatus Hodarchaeota archaeon]